MVYRWQEKSKKSPRDVEKENNLRFINRDNTAISIAH